MLPWFESWGNDKKRAMAATRCCAGTESMANLTAAIRCGSIIRQKENPQRIST
jgi:hypothetical protein